MSVDTDPFALFDLPRRHAASRDAIEQRYLELSRAAHPDNVVGEGTAARRAAVERASAVNAAYRVLRDPVLRAEALVKLGGIDLDSTDPERGAPHPTQAFLLEMIDLRERLDDGGPDGVAALRDDVEARCDAALDAAVDALDAGEVRRAAEHLVARRYFQRFLDETDSSAP
ncbi:Fe-S protein assembly co-chaperone HscB [Nannocystis pusilla]|uniref:Fe-S protein assembly co-chaperone HscB n=1 Tax=Nannocystis pusilla TaxID=889268 RepID=UPI003DA632FC